MQLRKTLGLAGLAAAAGYWLWRYLSPQHSVMMLQNQVVVITGASSGIGRALAMAFAHQGARLVLVARRAEQLEIVRREIEPYAEEVLVLPTDLRDEAQLEALLRESLQAFGRIDVLVNNAGITHNGRLQSQSAAQLRQTMEVDLYAPMRLTQLVIPHMLRQQRGAIINIGSSSSRTAAPFFTTYTAAKYGIAGFSTSLRRELAGTGISVMLAMPGWTETNMLHAEQLPPEYRTLAIQSPELVAGRIVEALVRGDRELLLGGGTVRFVVFLETHFPRLAGLGWRYAMQRDWEQVAAAFTTKAQEEPA